MEERPDTLYAIDSIGGQIVSSTFKESMDNKIYHKSNEISVQYPVTKLLFHPVNPNIFCTTSDYFRIYSLSNQIELKHVMSNYRKVGQQQQELIAPLTSFDWNLQDTSLCVTSSVDTTCTIWDMNLLQAKTQLIAHDSDVFDVSFSSGVDIFSSAGQDGSVRIFDCRYIDTDPDRWHIQQYCMKPMVLVWPGWNGTKEILIISLRLLLILLMWLSLT
jgi:WD40 repeat protein